MIVYILVINFKEDRIFYKIIDSVVWEWIQDSVWPVTADEAQVKVPPAILKRMQREQSTITDEPVPDRFVSSRQGFAFDKAVFAPPIVLESNITGYGGIPMVFRNRSDLEDAILDNGFTVREEREWVA